MKLRFLIYGSLLSVTLALPIVYKTIDCNLQRQETVIREKKKNFFSDMERIEFLLAAKATNTDSFLYHFDKALSYATLNLEMIQEDLAKILGSLKS